MAGSNDQLVNLLTELRRLVVQFEALPAGSASSSALAQRVDGLAVLADQLCQAYQNSKTRNAERVIDALARFRSYVDANRSALNTPVDVGRIRRALADRYEHILAAVRSTPHLAKIGDTLGTLRPKNYWRNLFHISMGLLGVATYEWLTASRQETLLVLGVVFGVYAFLDMIRRLHPSLNHLIYNLAFKLIARPRERYQTPAATWYVLGLFVAVAIADQTHAQLAALVLGLGDPAATLIGKRWGRKKIYKDRSWVGSISFVAITFAASVVFLVAAREWSTGLIILTALIASFAGAIAEIFSNDRLDDNLLIPCAVATALTLCLGT